MKTDQDINFAVAIAAGWMRQMAGDECLGWISSELGDPKAKSPFQKEPPDYMHDANAVIALLEKEPDTSSLRIERWFKRQGGQVMTSLPLNWAIGFIPVEFISSDMDAVLPAPYQFTPKDAGRHTFQLTLLTPDTDQWIEVDDQVDGTPSGTLDGITIKAP